MSQCCWKNGKFVVCNRHPCENQLQSIWRGKQHENEPTDGSWSFNKKNEELLKFDRFAFEWFICESFPWYHPTLSEHLNASIMLPHDLCFRNINYNQLPDGGWDGLCAFQRGLCFVSGRCTVWENGNKSRRWLACTTCEQEKAFCAWLFIDFSSRPSTPVCILEL